MAHPNLGDSLDTETLDQILEMDDDEDDREFSKSIVYGFFEQAETTFKEIDESLEDKDLNRLSELGHYLKGSSATIGLTHMKNSCEKIQHLGKHMDETGAKPLEKDEQCLKLIKAELVKLRKEYKHCEVELRKFFGPL